MVDLKSRYIFIINKSKSCSISAHTIYYSNYYIAYSIGTIYVNINLTKTPGIQIFLGHCRSTPHQIQF